MSEKLRKCREELLAVIREIRDNMVYPAIPQNKEGQPFQLSPAASHSENKWDATGCPPVLHPVTGGLKLAHGKGILTDIYCNNSQCKRWSMYNNEDLLNHDSNATAMRKFIRSEFKEGECLHKKMCTQNIPGNLLDICAKKEPVLMVTGEPRSVTTKEDDEIIEIILDMEDDYNHRQF